MKWANLTEISFGNYFVKVSCRRTNGVVLK